MASNQIIRRRHTKTQRISSRGWNNAPGPHGQCGSAAPCAHQWFTHDDFPPKKVQPPERAARRLPREADLNKTGCASVWAMNSATLGKNMVHLPNSCPRFRLHHHRRLRKARNNAPGPHAQCGSAAPCAHQWFAHDDFPPKKVQPKKTGCQQDCSLCLCHLLAPRSRNLQRWPVTLRLPSFPCTGGGSCPFLLPPVRLKACDFFLKLCITPLGLSRGRVTNMCHCLRLTEEFCRGARQLV